MTAIVPAGTAEFGQRRKSGLVRGAPVKRLKRGAPSSKLCLCFAFGVLCSVVTAQSLEKTDLPITGYRPHTGHYYAPAQYSGRVFGDGQVYVYAGDMACGKSGVHGDYVGGFMTADLSSMPESISVVAANLRFYQTDDASSTRPRVMLIPDAGSVSPDTLWWGILHGPIVSPEATSPYRWNSRELNAEGLHAIDTCRGRTTVSFGLFSYDHQFEVVLMGGYTRGRLDVRPYVDVTFTTELGYFDIAGVGLSLASGPLNAGAAETLVAALTNTGSAPAPAFWLYAGLGVGATESLQVSGLDPGETLALHVPFTAPSASGILTPDVWTVAPGDWCRFNDTMRQSWYVFPPNAYRAEGFESDAAYRFPPSGWVVVDLADHEGSWELDVGGSYAGHSGGYTAFSYDNDFVSDDWLITPGLQPRAGVADTLGLFFRSIGVPNYSLQAWALGSQNPYDTLGLLKNTTIQDSWAEMKLALDQYDGYVVYVGFRRYADFGCAVALDDVWFTSDILPGASELGEPVPPARFALEPTVSSGRGVRLRYGLPRAGRLRIAIADIAGMTVCSMDLVLAELDGSVRLETRNLPAGVYFVGVSSIYGAQTRKLVLTE